jgi:hypothetical protein
MRPVHWSNGRNLRLVTLKDGAHKRGLISLVFSGEAGRFDDLTISIIKRERAKAWLSPLSSKTRLLKRSGLEGQPEAEAQFTLAAVVEAGIQVRAHGETGEGVLRDRIGHAEIPVVE